MSRVKRGVTSHAKHKKVYKLAKGFRGRELALQELGSQLLERVRGDLSPLAKVEQEPKFEGRQMVMVFAPR